MAAHAAGFCAVGAYCGWVKLRDAEAAPARVQAVRGTPAVEVFLVSSRELRAMELREARRAAPPARAPRPVEIAPPDEPRVLPVELPDEPQPMAAATTAQPADAPAQRPRPRWFIGEPNRVIAAAEQPRTQEVRKPEETPPAQPAGPQEPPRPVIAAASPSQAGADCGAQSVEAIRPEYPPACIRRGEQGLVLVEVRVLSDGSAGDVRIAKGSGYRALDEAAVQAARKARYTPARRGGRSVDAWVTLPVRFVLK